MTLSVSPALDPRCWIPRCRSASIDMDELVEFQESSRRGAEVTKIGIEMSSEKKARTEIILFWLFVSDGETWDNLKVERLGADVSNVNL